VHLCTYRLHISFCTVFFQRDEEYRGVECLCVQNNPEFILISVYQMLLDPCMTMSLSLLSSDDKLNTTDMSS
jgi:hypothetical protein